MSSAILLYILAIILIIAGLVGTVVPALPGMPLMFAGMLLVAWIGHFQVISLTVVFVLAALTLIALVADFIAGALGAKRVGASNLAIIGATIGTVAGLFMAPMGIIIGPFAGAAIGEYLHQQNGSNTGDSKNQLAQGLAQATKVGIHTWIGMAIGIGVKVALAFVMLGIFIFSWMF